MHLLLKVMKNVAGLLPALGVRASDLMMAGDGVIRAKALRHCIIALVLSFVRSGTSAHHYHLSASKYNALVLLTVRTTTFITVLLTRVGHSPLETIPKQGNLRFENSN